MADQTTVARSRIQVNLVGLEKADYRGLPSTLCQGCGHNSISSQLIAACYELNIVPENMVKFSGIGCSSKSLFSREKTSKEVASFERLLAGSSV